MLGLAETKRYLAQFRDGHGKEFLRWVDVMPDGSVYVEGENKQTKPAQTWLAKQIQAKAGL